MGSRQVIEDLGLKMGKNLRVCEWQAFDDQIF